MRSLGIRIRPGPRKRRPIAGDRVRFATTIDRTGRQQASEASIDGVGRAVATPRSDGLPRDLRRTPLGVVRTALDLLAVGTLVTVLALGLLVWRMPAWVVVLYAGMSAASLLLYVSDKRSAANGGWRTPESTLHLVSLAGGWPGGNTASEQSKTFIAAFAAAAGDSFGKPVDN